MMALTDRARRVLRFLWSGWAGLAGLAVFAAVWQLGAEAYGSFVLPMPAATLNTLFRLVGDPENRLLVLSTGMRALGGFALAAALGTIAGVIAGYNPAVMRLARPQVTVLIGVPPIAWIVLLMIWFGMGAGTVIATAAIAALPLVFVGAAEGIQTRDRALEDMARMAGLSPLARLFKISLRQMLHVLFPSLVMALGTAFKAAVMAELLANAGGIGGALANARSALDVEAALAWILLSVIALIGVEYGLVQPLRAEAEAWRQAAQPWGVRR
ncbi:ABC transporter permease subunit [Rhizobium sp. RU36D]|uniref:ABC transporter permease n=1 Tax=Rhizobium sp. RU36D TaxID=1907415 RepID=UPI0009D8A769|nr:ABC transporter permease subunit [Rhizobium sp. RU36D]SMD11925.1 NitT/TauT family transport system permease protein [Rhizobium sp. RU36D]